MNAIYKVIWNDALRLYQVVNEMCRSRRKACSANAVHSAAACVNCAAQEESGRTGTSTALRKSTLAVAAAVTVGLTGAAGATPLPIVFPNASINLTGASTEEPQEIEADQLPEDGEAYQIQSSVFTTTTTNLASQDDQPAGTSIGSLIQVEGRYFLDENHPLQILDANGIVYNSENSEDRLKLSTPDADLYYRLGLSSSTEGGYSFLTLKRDLTRIDLQQTEGDGLEIRAGEVSGDHMADLQAAITGNGNVHFAFSSDDTTNQDATTGYLYLTEQHYDLSAQALEDEQTSSYTGRTYVGNYGDQLNVDVVFGKSDAFGNTSNLDVASGSAVRFADKSGSEHWTQTVGGLTGRGELDLGSAAELTLGQSSNDAGNVVSNDNGDFFIRIDNELTGSDSAVFHVALDGDVAGYEVVFNNDVNNGGELSEGFTSLITLENAAVSSYRTDATNFQGLGIDSPNEVLMHSTLELLGGGVLRTDGTGEVNNLIVTGGNDSQASFAFENVDLGHEGALLEVTDLTLNQASTTVELESFASSGELEDATVGVGFLEADEGVETALIHAENISGSGKLQLGEAADEGTVTQLTGEGGDADVIADLTWNFDRDLRLEAGEGSDGTFYADYRLTNVDVKDNKTFEIAASEDTGSEATFTAAISGTGNVLIDAARGENETTVHLGGASASSYTGRTTVAENTTVVLESSSAMGQTSELDAQGDVVLEEDVQQSVGGIAGSGSITLHAGSELFLDRKLGEGEGNAEITNALFGEGAFKADLADTDNHLIFNAEDESNFSGALELSNGWLDLSEGRNQAVLANADVTIGSSARLSISSDDGNSASFGSLTVQADAEPVEVRNLVIGGPASLVVTDGIAFEGTQTTIALDGVSVADNANLLSFDAANLDGASSALQDFMTAGGGISVPEGGSVSLDLNGLSTTLAYMQHGVHAADTHWTIDTALQLTDDSGKLQAGVALTQIDVLGALEFSSAGTLSAVLTSSADNAAAEMVFSSGSNVVIAGENNSGYVGAISVENGGSATLNAALGSLSSLTVADGGAFSLGDGVEQTISSLGLGKGAITLTAEDSTLSLVQTGDAEVWNDLNGVGTFAVDLGGGSLSFMTQNAFDGTLRLDDAVFRLQDADGVYNQTAAQGAVIVLGEDSTLEAVRTSEAAGLVFAGGTAVIPGGDAGADAPLTVGDIDFTGGGKISAGGVNLTGTQSLFALAGSRAEAHSFHRFDDGQRFVDHARKRTGRFERDPQ